ncbi:helix-turn-helix domain-containing protein [Flavobacterium sp. NKUCC04_CG]|nr:helix-turn-helix domain-containing protein [Flavobacterium sp. NKUCC04_CG]MBW3519982.1 helix-turn-helix domain-containing protein [Flavobacterium sp. NKUCC04_CG]
MSIAALAQRVGYKHYNHFSMAFRKRFGSVPSSF